MKQKENISEELAGLKISLTLHQENPYTVPAGYFDGLLGQVLSRIKEMETGLAGNKDYVSPLLNKVGKQIPFEVPQGYFDGLAATALQSIREVVIHESPTEELKSLSPLLTGLKKEMPYSVPAGYFEKLADKSVNEENKSQTKIISIARAKWFRYAVAATVVGIITLAGFLFLGKENTAQTGSKVMAKFTRDIKKMNETQKEDLIDFIDAGMTGDETTQLNTKPATAEIKDLLKDVSDEELKDFQEQTEDVEEVLMTN